MRHSLSKLSVLFGVLVIAAMCIPLDLLAQWEEADTVQVEGDAPKDGAVRIRIDESGISVEGQVTDTGDTTTERRIIFDSGTGTATSRRYREKGTEIVKFGEDVHVERDELVRGDIVVFGGDVTIEGKVVGNVVVMAGNADILSGAEVNGDVVVIGGALEEEAEVVIHGERFEVKELALPVSDFSQFFGSHARFFGFFFVPVQFFISVMLSFLIVLFLRDRVVRTQEHVQESFLKSFGAGFLVVFIGASVVCFLAIILLITLIGIPLALVLIVSCIAVFIVARTVFVYALGSKVNEVMKMQTSNPFAVVLVGTAALYLPALLGYGITLLPFGEVVGSLLRVLGTLISIFAYLVGLGALFISRFGGRPVSRPATTAPAVQPE